ncbi:MAG: metallophosphoesterase [Bacteroidota bacterium]
MRIGALFSLAVFIGLFFFLDWSVIQNMLPILETIDFSEMGQKLYWLINIGLPMLMFGSFVFIGRSSFITATLGSVFITLLITKVVFLLGLLFGEFIELVTHGFQYLIFQKSNGDLTANPDLFKSQLAASIAAVPFFAFLFGITKGKYNYTLHQHEVFFPDLPEAFDGFTITQISDVHSGGFHNRQEVAKGIQLINDQQSDLFVFTGDLVNNQATEIEPWIDLFKTIKAPYGQFSILGNHDYGDYVAWPSTEAKNQNMQRLFSNHQKIGFRLLLDEQIIIEKDGAKIALMGVENWGIGFGKRGNLNKALSGLPQNMFKILLSHDPSHWDHEVKNNQNKIHLTFSGHTHGMQMGVELFGWKWSPSKFRYKKWAGLYEENNRYLYVNRGFGFLGFAGRVGIWPEVTKITLRKKK